MPLNVLLVGLGGNNGSTFAASIMAHKEKITWKDHSGKICRPDWLGSTIMMGSTSREDRKTFFEAYPFTSPEDIVVGGWDISSANLSEAVRRAGVLNWQIEERLREKLEKVVPMRAYYDASYIASNQGSRADNVLSSDTPLSEVLTHLRLQISLFKRSSETIVLWTANTEKMVEEIPDIHEGRWENLERAIRDDRKDLVSPSMMYAAASILEGCAYLNGSPQNTLVPALRDLARRMNVFVGGNDFKTGQTRFKSMMMDFLSLCGIRVSSIASYNHLGNNDGKNLSEDHCFRSKELSKRDVVLDVVEGNPKLYEGNSPDHCIVIKYIPNVGDSKRAIDEYVADIFMGGRQTFSIYNVCEDSLLAVPVMLDIILVTDFFNRHGLSSQTGRYFFPNLFPLSLFFKAPLPDRSGRVVNIFREQHRILEKCMEESFSAEVSNVFITESSSTLSFTGSEREFDEERDEDQN
ncbi:MAG: inositol-3-phosphate synthase [Cyanobacteriota bacterium]|nr:inositol-3-phosphate synthase [Cyanobacteriota bacterium]